jgi:hypothetical protein
MISIKRGASLSKLRPQMLIAIQIAHEVYLERGSQEMVITSGDDSKHRPGSLHYEGKAVDLRTLNLLMDDAMKAAIADSIQRRLGDQYRCAFEPTTPTRTEHIHAEFLG